MILVEAGKRSPWSRPDESEFADDFRAAAEFRAEHDRDSYMRELCETMLLDFDSNIDWSLPPIGETLGVTYALYLKKYVAWCEEVGIRAIIADPFFVAQYLRELAEEGFTDLHGVREALRRAHWLQGHGDGTAHPSVDAVIAKYGKEETMAYDPKNGPVDQDKTTCGKPLPTATDLEMDKASPSPFWDKADEMASGQSDLAKNFNRPHNPSRGQK